MNLKMKADAAATATVTILSDTKCIFSDEVSPNYGQAHFILEAEDKQELWDKIKSHTIRLAKPTRFAPVVVIMRDAKHSRHPLK